jgi:hypothetical protein
MTDPTDPKVPNATTLAAMAEAEKMIADAKAASPEISVTLDELLAAVTKHREVLGLCDFTDEDRAAIAASHVPSEAAYFEREREGLIDLEAIESDEAHAAALQEIAALWNAAIGTPEYDRLAAMIAAVHNYEERRWPIRSEAD